MSRDAQDAFNQILDLSLRLGVVDIFTVIAWQVNEVPSDQIIQELTDKIQAQRAAS